MPVSLDEFGALARSRRTHMLVDRERSIPFELVEELCEIATWAPNHKKTWPWRFAWVTGDGRLRLGRAFVDDMIAIDFGDDVKRTKTLTKYTRTPGVLVVGCAHHDHPGLNDENRDAVAAGIQNLLLAATSAGLATFWSTAPVMSGPKTLALCGFESDDRIISMVYMGWPSGTVEAPSRPDVVVQRITD